MKKGSKEKQYEELQIAEKKYGRSKFGLMANQVWNEDPKRITFTLARYKFVSKMLQGYNKVLEIGCGDGFGSRIVKQNVKKLELSDFDKIFLDDINNNVNKKWKLKTYQHDFVKDGKLISSNYDAIYSLDVLEHIKKKNEKIFISNINKSLKNDGVAIYGMPSLESQKFASKQSKIGHVNCKSGKDLKQFLQSYYKKVFMFSMNDEVLHTGFFPMSHYLIALCVTKK